MDENVQVQQEEVVEQPAQQDVASEPAQEEAVALPEFEVGYIVGKLPDGNLYFQVIGSKQGLIELAGLHKIAEHRLTTALDANQGSGSIVVSKQLQHLAQYLGQLMETQKVILNFITQGRAAQDEERRILVPR